jgi:hypothetical protein
MAEINPSIKIEGSLFKFIASIFKKHDIHGVLVGGYALIANKVQRTTFDIDFMVTAVDCGKIEPDLIKSGYGVFNRQDAFVQFKSTVPGLRDIDFLIGDAHTVAKIISQGKTITIAGESFMIPSADDELNLPEIQIEPTPPSLRTMDEIDTWIEEDYALFFDRDIYEKEKRLNSVNVPFKLD